MSADGAPRPLVGRDDELAALLGAVERAAAGQAGAVLVAGDAGVGKSRLVAELVTRAETDGVLALVGHCVELGDGELPYAPLAGALRALAARLDPATLEVVLGPARGELARLVPDLGDAAPTTASGAFATARLFELLLGVLRRAGTDAPVLLVVEDLHWADGSTRDLLRFLARAARDERLALVATYRTDALHRAHPLRPYAAELARDPRVRRIELRPLDRAAFADHVAAFRGALPSPAELDRLFERSEGNPFFTEELLVAGPELPATLRDAMLAHLERLSPTAQAAVRVLAAAGRRVDYPLLAATSRLPAPALAEALREAVAAQVLVPREGAYELRHALLREAAYGELLPGERERLHAELAAELEARSGDAADHAALAHHWRAAGEPARSLAASVRAGEESAKVYAYPEAARHLQRALELWDLVTPAARAGLDRVEIATAAAQAAAAAGEHGVAIALAEQALALVDAGSEPLRAAVLQARLARCLDQAGRGDEALPASARAVALLPAGPSSERARVLEAHARLLLLAGRAEEARAPVDEAIAIARALGLRDVEAAALTTNVISWHGRAEAAVAAGAAALRAARAEGDPETLLRAHVNAGEALDQAGRIEEAYELALAGVEVSRRVGAERVLGALLKAEAATRLIKLGRFDEALAGVEDALRAAPAGIAATALQMAAALVAAHRGDADGVARAARGAREGARDASAGMWSARTAAAEAELALWGRDDERATAIVERALGELGGVEYLLYTALLYPLGGWALADRGLRARALRRPAEAEEARAAASALGDRFDAQLADPLPPELAAHRAQLHAELGRLAEPPDAAAWAAAGGRWEALGFSFHVAFCAWREAAARLEGDDDRDRAGPLLAAAQRTARELGAEPLLAAVEGLARRARVALEPGAGRERGAAAAGTDLSRRELDVLELIAEGRTNREIGAALFISEKTVSVHVSRILAKLGAANRAQAATIAHRLGIGG